MADDNNSSMEEKKQDKAKEEVIDEDPSSGSSVTPSAVNSLETLITTLNTFPTRIYTSTMALTHNVGTRIRKFSDALRGENVDSDTKKSYASVKKPHFEYAEKIRKEDPPLYTELSLFGKQIESHDTNTKSIMVKKWFTQRLTGPLAQPIPS